MGNPEKVCPGPFRSLSHDCQRALRLLLLVARFRAERQLAMSQFHRGVARPTTTPAVNNRTPSLTLSKKDFFELLGAKGDVEISQFLTTRGCWAPAEQSGQCSPVDSGDEMTTLQRPSSPPTPLKTLLVLWLGNCAQEEWRKAARDI